jgi:hypothetical protein
MDLSTIEIIVGLACVIVGPAGTAWIGTRTGLNGVKRDVAAIKQTVGEIQTAQHQGEVMMALTRQRVDTVVTHCEFIHERPVSEHPRNER